MFTPVVPLDAAELAIEATVAAVAAPTVSPEYVYELRVVEKVKQILPNVKIPSVLLPAAEPPYEATVAAPPALTTQPE